MRLLHIPTARYHCKEISKQEFERLLRNYSGIRGEVFMQEENNNLFQFTNATDKHDFIPFCGAEFMWIADD